MRHWWAVAMVLASALLLVAFTVGYVGWQQQRNDRRWCDLLSSLDQPDVPATTERGLEIQRQIHTLRLDLDCTGGP